MTACPMIIGRSIPVIRSRSAKEPQAMASEVAPWIHSSSRHDAPRDMVINLAREDPPMEIVEEKVFHIWCTRVPTGMHRSLHLRRPGSGE